MFTMRVNRFAVLSVSVVMRLSSGLLLVAPARQEREREPEVLDVFRSRFHITVFLVGGQKITYLCK